jgi:hypothetical protein
MAVKVRVRSPLRLDPVQLAGFYKRAQESLVFVLDEETVASTKSDRPDVRSMVLLSILIHCSVINGISSCQYFAMCLRASPVRDLAKTCVSDLFQLVSKPAIIEADLSCQSASLSGAIKLRIYVLAR